jgi:KaiC/GvpD/RAD55 family RecA-like ATPase
VCSANCPVNASSNFTDVGIEYVVNSSKRCGSFILRKAEDVLVRPMIEDYPGIPQEIRTFFQADYGQTLLIKGTPGTGKTAFALTLLSTLKGNGAYLSTRVDPETLYMQHPWIKSEISPDNIVDTTQSGREHATKPDAVTIKPLKYTNVPEFLKAVYTRTEEMEKPIIIIDSWDAVVSYAGFYESREREKLEHNLCDFSRKTKTKIILLVEYTGQTALDYLVDGVIAIESDMYEERRLRRMIMQKLRGCEITNPVRLFSLNNGVFKAFTEFKGVEMDGENSGIPAPFPDLSDMRISTGIRDLDRVINGYGTFNLFEGDYVPYDLLARALSINTLNLGRHLFFISPKQNEFMSKISSYVKAEYKDNIEVVEDVQDLKARIKGGKDTVLLNLEEVEDVDKVVREVMSSIKEHGNVVMCFGGREGGKGKDLNTISSVHIKTNFSSGIPCLYGEMPRTEIYAMEMEPHAQESAPIITLTPIV